MLGENSSFFFSSQLCRDAIKEKGKKNLKDIAKTSKYHLGTMADWSWRLNKCRGRAASNLLFIMFDQIWDFGGEKQML